MTPPRYTIPMRPERDLSVREVHLTAAIRAGVLGAVAFLVVYYLTLGLLPSVFSNPYMEAYWPVPAWAYRFDLAQFLGTLVVPPHPTPFTWCLGLLLVFGTLVGQAVVYAVLLSWVQQHSDTVKGIGYGLLNGIGLVLFVSIADGLHPALMRNVVMDPGYFMVGWSFWAPFQILLVHILYGAVLGAVYERRR